MSNLGEGFQKVISKQEPDSSLLMPLMTWLSGYQPNIEACDTVNTSFFFVDKSVLSRYLILHNSLKHFIKYPKVESATTLDFFNDAIIKKYNWSPNDLRANKSVLDIEYLKRELSKEFGFSEEEKQLLMGGSNGDKSRKDVTKRGDFRRRVKSNP